MHKLLTDGNKQYFYPVGMLMNFKGHHDKIPNGAVVALISGQ